jgi:hypothetical protein
MKPRVIIESPYAGDVERNTAYARACVRDSLMRGENPIAFHLLHTQPGILDDQTPAERELGISTSLEWYASGAIDICAVYEDVRISTGMRRGIAAAIAAGVPVRYRRVGMW